MVGWLEIVLMILCLSWADAADVKPTLTKNANTDRYEILFKLFKTYTPKFGFLWEGLDENLHPNQKHNCIEIKNSKIDPRVN